jgi:hypothetical protein
MFTDAELSDARRFCGYAIGPLVTAPQQARVSLDRRIGGLSKAELVLVRQFLETLRGLERDAIASAANLDTESAAIWTRNRTELAERHHLLDDWRRRFCALMGVPPGPALVSRTAPFLVV